jgi:hypothetical protein
VSVLQVAYLHSTDECIELADERSASLVGYASARDAGIATSSVFAGKATETMAVLLKTLPGLPIFGVCDTQSSSGIRSGVREKIRSMKSSYAARIMGSRVSGRPSLWPRPCSRRVSDS